MSGLQGRAESSAAAIRAAEQAYQAVFERHRRADFLLLSVPKAGRTWHRALLGCYLAKLARRPTQEALKLGRLCKAAQIPRIVYSHNAASFGNDLPATHPLIASPALWEGKGVLLLVRNPKDVLVSAYHHARFRSGAFRGSFSDFIRDPRTGLDLIMSAYRRWDANRGRASQFEVISYEQMHRDTAEVLRTSLRAVGLVPDESLVAEAVDFCRFDRMRQHEDSGFFASSRLSTGDDMRARKVRQGKVGGSHDYFTDADEAFADERISDGGDPFAAYY